MHRAEYAVHSLLFVLSFSAGNGKYMWECGALCKFTIYLASIYLLVLLLWLFCTEICFYFFSQVSISCLNLLSGGSHQRFTSA